MKILFGLIFTLSAVVLGQTYIDNIINSVFDAMDYNFDGILFKTEISLFIRTYDADHDTFISWVEYTTAVDEHAHDVVLTSIYRNLFNHFDTDKDGRISHHDLDVIFARADTNRNNSVSKTEFHE